METAIMAIRVALLILVTGAFAALWSGDHPGQIAAAIQPVMDVDQFRQITPPQTPETFSGLPVERAAGSRVATNSSLTSIPLPYGITVGTYLVADRFGQTQVRVVGTNDVMPGAASSISELKNSYSIESKGNRWHFIRIESKQEHRTAILAPSAIRR